MKILLPLLAYQLCWWGAVLAAAHGIPWIGPCLALAAAALVLNFSDDFFADAVLLGLAAGLGWALDTLLMKLGVLRFADEARLGPGSPLWMAGLWGAFGVTLSHLWGFLKGRVWLAAAFGAVGGPLACFAGMRLGALTVLRDETGWLAIGGEYALAMAVLVHAWRRVGGLAPRQLAEAQAEGSAGKETHP